MANSLNAYKLDDQTLKLVIKIKTQRRRFSLCRQKLKVIMVTTHARDDSSAPLLESPLNMYVLLPENDPEAWDEEFDDQSHTEFHPLFMRT